MKGGKLTAGGVAEPDVWGELGRGAWASFVAEREAERRREGERRRSPRPRARFSRRETRTKKGGRQ